MSSSHQPDFLPTHPITESPHQVQLEPESYRVLYDNTPLFYFTIDRSGLVRTVNQFGAARLGYTVAELVGRSVVDTFHPDDRAPLQQALDEFLPAASEELPSAEWEFRQQGRDRRSIWVKITVQSMQPDDGVLFICEDIHDRKQSQIALQQQLERECLVSAIAQHIRQSLNLTDILNTAVSEVRELLHVDRVFIYQFQPDWSGIILVESVDSAWSSLLGSRIKDSFFGSLEGRRLYKYGRIQAIDDIYTAGLSACHVDLLAKRQIRANLVVPIVQEQALWGLLVANHCAAPRPWQSVEIDLLNRLAAQLAIAIQQSELYQQVRQFNIELEQQVQERTAQLQQALCFEAMLKRITDKVRDSLDESQILQTAVKELALGLKVAGCDAALYDLEQGVFTICYEHTIGLPPMQGTTIALADRPEIYTQLLQGQCFQFCTTVGDAARPTKPQYAILTCAIVDDQGVLGDLWLFQDSQVAFSEPEMRLVQQVANQCAIALRQARLYQASRHQIQELETLHQLKDEFLSTVSHEFRSPMSNIRMAIQLLNLSLQDANLPTQNRDKMQRYLEILQNECQREISLINDLLDLQQLEAGGELLAPSAIELQRWLPQLLAPFRERAHDRQQTIALTVAPDVPPIVSDAASLERIVVELVHNACKYTPPGEQITVCARLSGSDSERRVQISVTSAGVEIPLNEQDRIFDKFYRIPSGDRWRQGGTGLGLALVKKLVASLSGTVQVESTADRTVFAIVIPLFSTRKVVGQQSPRTSGRHPLEDGVDYSAESRLPRSSQRF